MSNASVSFIGADNGVNSTLDEQRALYLKMFMGEVLTAFEKETVVLDKHTIRTIASGKSAQFPVIGNMPDAEYHTPGEEILGQEIKQGERIITIDKLLISHVFLADIDEAMSHFEVRGKYSRMMGQKLAQTFDNHVMREMIACGTAADVAGLGTDGQGDEITDANLASGVAATKLQAWVDFLYAAAENLDNRFVPGTRYCMLKPADYYTFVKEVMSNGFSAINRDYGGNGSFADGTVINVAGIKLIPTPMLPTADYTSDAFHKVDCSGVKSVVFTEDAVGTVKLMDLSLQSEWDIRRQGTLLVGRYAMGHGILQPECVVVGKSA